VADKMCLGENQELEGEQLDKTYLEDNLEMEEEMEVKKFMEEKLGVAGEPVNGRRIS